MVWSCQKNAKPKIAITNCNSYSGQNKGKRRIMQKMENRVKEDLNVMGIRNRQAIDRDCQEWRTPVLEAKVHNGQ